MEDFSLFDQQNFNFWRTTLCIMHNYREIPEDLDHSAWSETYVDILSQSRKQSLNAMSTRSRAGYFRHNQHTAFLNLPPWEIKEPLWETWRFQPPEEEI